MPLIMNEFYPMLQTDVVGYSEPLRLTWPWGILTEQSRVCCFPALWLTRGYAERFIRQYLQHTQVQRLHTVKINILLM